jgi:hypothetical protein
MDKPLRERTQTEPEITPSELGIAASIRRGASDSVPANAELQLN